MALSKCTAILALAAGAVCLPAPANAAVTINIVESGPGVLAIATGTLDLTGLTLVGPFSSSGAIRGSTAFVSVGIPLTVSGYSGLTGPSSFGSGSFFFASNSVGTPFAINGGGFVSPYVFVPTTYVSGSAIGGQAVWFGATFAALGLTPGQYDFTAPNDTITVNIGPVSGAVPEPSTWAMMLLGFGGIGFTMRRSKRRTAYFG
jgi:hypothetical protein